VIGIDLGKLKEEHRRFVAQHEAMVRQELERAGHLASDHVKRHSLFKRRSARSLKDNTSHTIARAAGGLRLRLKWSKHYAGYIEYGTPRHDIVAWNPDGYLHFYWEKKKRWVRARIVDHPGTKPYKFGWRATYAAYRSLGDLLTSGMGRVAK